MRNHKLPIFLIIYLALAGGCRQQEEFVPRPTTGKSELDVLNDADIWQKKDASVRDWSRVSATGSMEPFLNQHSVALWEKVNEGTPLSDGEVVLFDRGDSHRVCHVVVEQKSKSAYLSGYNNHESDGWYPKSKISYRLVGQLYLPR